ncbi:MAG: PQQ-binding-like beta-propeller repeat protein [Verrucomicrobia bacterium]|nr:PQQ-binding-like beta-propeller repeat protein [Verrucomicrobiota bacterium]
MSPKIFFLLAALAACTGSIHAADWPYWRGPQRNGVSAETGVPEKFPAGGPAIAWQAKVGLGFSSFVVAKGRAFTMGHAAGKDTVFAFDATTGKALWKHSYPADLGDKFFEGGTTGTPTVDGERVFTLSRWGDVFCLEAASGKIVWSKRVQDETNVRIPDWGFAGAPLAHENLLVLNVGEAGLALDKATGKIIWQSADENAGYSTPLPVKRGNDWLALLGTGAGYVAVNLRDGKEAWRIKWLTEYGVNASDPIVDGDKIFLCTGYGKGGALFELGADGPKQIWKTKMFHTQLNGAVLFQGHLYGADGDTTEKASLKCLDFATGAEKWSQPRFGSGSVIVADGKLIALGGTGELTIAPASPDGFQPTARAQVLGGKCWTAPVLANGLLYCRNGRGDVAVVDLRKR